MTAERYDGPLSLTINFCLLNYNYVELAAIYNYEPLRDNIKNSGHEGELFIDDLEVFLNTNREPIQDNEPGKEMSEEEFKEQFTYPLPPEVFDKICIYLDGLMVLEAKQDYMH